ncbi:PilZ domain-containing protein [bacterium]|nr:PilZ domain-containing protein [bacterium]
MDERRKLGRKPTADYFTSGKRTRRGFFAVYDDRTNSLLGHLADVSAEGMMIVSGEPVDIALMYDIRIELPKNVDGRDSITLYARPVWTAQNAEDGLYHTGFHFTRIEPTEISIISRLFGD